VIAKIAYLTISVEICEIKNANFVNKLTFFNKHSKRKIKENDVWFFFGTVKTSTIFHFQYNTKFLKSKKALII
jgi:hypothetical protein